MRIAQNFRKRSVYPTSGHVILPKWLKGVRPTGNQYPSTLWITDWSAEP